MAPPRRTPDGRSLARFGARADVVVRGARRELIYRWNAPRSPVARVALAPVFVAAVLITVLVSLALLLVALALAAAAAAMFVLVMLLARLRLVRRR